MSRPVARPASPPEHEPFGTGSATRCGPPPGVEQVILPDTLPRSWEAPFGRCNYPLRPHEERLPHCTAASPPSRPSPPPHPRPSPRLKLELRISCPRAFLGEEAWMKVKLAAGWERVQDLSLGLKEPLLSRAGGRREYEIYSAFFPVPKDSRTGSRRLRARLVLCWGGAGPWSAGGIGGLVSWGTDPGARISPTPHRHAHTPETGDSGEDWFSLL